MSLAGQAQPHQAGRGAGCQDFPVRPDMVGMGMGDEAARPGPLRVEPPADLRQVYSVLQVNFPAHSCSQEERKGHEVKGRKPAAAVAARTQPTAKYFLRANRQAVTKKAVSGTASIMPRMPPRA